MHRFNRSSRRAGLVLLFGASLFLSRQSFGQAEPAGVTTSPDTLSPYGAPVMGINFALDNTGVHNSATGWADAVTPILSYRFNRHLLLEASAPWYPTVTSYVTRKGNNPAPRLATGTNLFGDTIATGEFEAERTKLGYIATVLGAFPTGNVHYGLGAGSTTYNVTNHFEYRVGAFTPDIEFGEGDNSSLANPTVHKSYVATGPIANFQAGGTVDLPLALELDLEAYENLPLGSQTVNGTVTHKGKNGRTHSTQVLEGTGAAEDNGVNAEVDLPLGSHFILNGVYERSFVQSLDTASAGLTWILRAPKDE